MSAPAELKMDVEVRGMAQYDAKLHTLELSAAKTIVGGALRAGAKVVNAAQVALAPKRTGALSRAIKVRAGKRSVGSGWVRIYSTVGQATFVGDQFYGGFQEWGWKAGPRRRSGLIKRRRKDNNFYQGRKGDARRQIPGEHYLEYGFNEAVSAAAAAISAEYCSRMAAYMTSGGGSAAASE